MKLPDFSVKKPVTITMFILIVVVLGVISLSKMGLDLMPDITFPVLSVVTTYEGVGSEDIEKLVTRPIEKSISTVKGVKNINSISREGFSAVLVEFEWGTNIDAAAQNTRDRIDLMKFLLPDDITTPQVLKFDPSMMPVFGLGITGDIDMRSLRKIVEDEIEPLIEQLDGVSSVFFMGGGEREIRVELDSNKLSTYRIPIQLVANQIELNNINQPGGRLEIAHQELTLRAIGELSSLKEIRNTFVDMRGDTPIFVKDLGKVIYTDKEVRAIARTNGKSGIMLMAYKESRANTVLVSSRVSKKVAEIEKTLPGNIELSMFFDMGVMIKRILKVTLTSAFWGALMAICILFLFLRSWRPTFIIATAIPLSMLATFLPLFALGYTINFVILIGVALGVGMIVDNAIVVIENSYRHLEITGDPALSASMGAKQVGMAITASTFTTVVVFIPLLFAKGIVGKIFSQLAITVGSALICSLIVALSIIPMLSSKLLGREAPKEKNKWMTAFRNWYEKKLTYLLENKKVLGIIVAALIILSIAIFPFMGKEYFPSVDDSMMLMKINRKVGTILKETDRVVKRVEELFSKQPEVLTYSGFIGVTEGGEMDAAMGTGPSGPYQGDFFVRLKEKTDRKRSTEEIQDTVRKGLPPFEDVDYKFMKMGQAMMTSGGKQEYPIQIKIFGADLETLTKISGEIKRKIKEIPGIYDTATTLEQGSPELGIKIDRLKAAKFGLSVSEISNVIKSNIKGISGGRFRQKGEEIDIKVILNEKDRSNLHKIKNLPVLTKKGAVLSLSQLTEITSRKGPIKLERENKRRKIVITANHGGSNLSKVMNLIKKELKDVYLPVGYSIEYGGEAENLKEMFITLLQLFALAILLIYMVMAAQFESFIHPLIIMVTIPLSYVGVILMLILVGKTISMPAAMGVLILFGIIVNNAIVLIDYVNHLRRNEGMDIRSAVIEGAKVRLRPILMTATTTMIAMVPMAVNKMEGSAVRSVVAVSIIGGLMVGTILTLFVIPVIYDYVEHRLKK